MEKYVTRTELEKIVNANRESFDQHKLLVTNHKWSVYLSANQLNLPSGARTEVEWDSIWWDCDGVGIVNYGYPVPERGTYLVCSEILWTEMPANVRCLICVYINNTLIRDSWSPSGAFVSSLNGNIIGTYVQAEVGNLIKIRAYHNAGVNTPDIYGTRYYSWFQVHLLSRRCY